MIVMDAALWRARTIRSRFWAVIAATLLTATTADAQFVSIPLGGPHRDKPSPNRSLLGAPTDIAEALSGQGRPTAMARLDEAQHPAELLTFLGLSLGARVLDVEVDTGYYSEIIGTAVGPAGHVTTLIPPAEFQVPAQRAALIDLTARFPRLSIVADDTARLRLSADSVDFVLLHLTYHQLYARGAGTAATLLQQVYTALRPGGIIGVVDYRARPGSDAADVAYNLGRIDEAVVLDNFRQAGFVLDSKSNLLANAADDGSRPVRALDDPANADRFILRFHKRE